MTAKQNGAVAVLVVLLVAAAYGVYLTGQDAPIPSTRVKSADSSVSVDQRSLTTAQRVVQLPMTADERADARDALRIADQEMDLSFADAVRDASMSQRRLSTEAQAIQARLQQAQQDLAADQAEAAQLTAAVAKANPTNADALTDQLNLAKAHVALHQDQEDDARQDLITAGGDPQGRMEAMVAEHEASSKRSDSTRFTITPLVAEQGLVRYTTAWWALRQKARRLARAKQLADSAAIRYAAQHTAIEAASSHDTAATEAVSGRISHEASAALLRSTERLANTNKAKASFDQHVGNQHRLSNAYAAWLAVVQGEQLTLVNRALRAAAGILIILLLAFLLDQWIEHVLGHTPMDRRRVQTLCMIIRVTLQVLAALAILLVIFGPPNNLGTFLGLAGAGLTVALKDFIIGFIGWFTLMGKNGIRMGDMVEINGVTGEVVELGMFQTELLETGDWSDTGHPTGRRVTFNNSFAIEGHYFNFSTSGQWLWDDVRVVVPAGRDPYPIADALERQVEDATAESARAAETHWKGTRRSPNLAALTAAPSVNVKPIAGGAEITVRYITHVGERSQIRADLYRSAVNLLGEKQPVASPPDNAPERPVAAPS